MNNDFDFDKIGKTTPYLTPEGFFNDTQDKILKKVQEDRAKRRRLRIAVITVMTVAALIAGLIFIPRKYGDMPDSKQLATKSFTADSEGTKKVAKEITHIQPEKETPTRISYNSSEKAKKASADTSVTDYNRNINDDWIEMLSDEDLNTLTALADNDEFLN